MLLAFKFQNILQRGHEVLKVDQMLLAAEMSWHMTYLEMGARLSLASKTIFSNASSDGLAGRIVDLTYNNTY